MKDSQRKKLGATGWLLKGAIEAKKAEAKKAHDNPKKAEFSSKSGYNVRMVNGKSYAEPLKDYLERKEAKRKAYRDHGVAGLYDHR